MIYIKVDKTSKTPLYKQISEQIEELILTNELAYNEKLPFEKDLAELYNVSDIVIKNAYNVLKQKNLVKAIKGKGSFVTAREIYIGDYHKVKKVVDPYDSSNEAVVIFVDENVNDYDAQIYFRDVEKHTFSCFYQVIRKNKRPICIQKFLYKEKGVFSLSDYKASDLNLQEYLMKKDKDINVKVLYNVANSEKTFSDLLLIDHKAPITIWSSLYSNIEGPFLYLKTIYPGEFFKMKANI